MALVRSSQATDPKIAELAVRLQLLEASLVTLKEEYTLLRTVTERDCSKSLSDALTSFIHLIKFVKKTDKTLVYWVEKGSGMKTALRCIGVDKRTETIVKKKTVRIKKEVHAVERKFKDTSEVFMTGLKAVQILNTKVTHYSISSVGNVQGDASEVLEEYDDHVSSIQIQIDAKSAECQVLEAQISGVQTDMSNTQAAVKGAQGARTAATVTAVVGGLSAVGFGVLTAFCPPVGLGGLFATMATGGTAGASVASTVAACQFDKEVTILRTRESNLQSRLGDLRLQIEVLEEEVQPLQSQRTEFQSTVKAIDSLKDRCTSLQSESQVILTELLEARKILSYIKMKLEEIASDLMTCEYAKTRREMALRLGDILRKIDDRKTIRGDDLKLEQVRNGIFGIEAQTPRVLMILGI